MEEKETIKPSPYFPKTHVYVGPTRSGKTMSANHVAEGKHHSFIVGRKFHPYDPYAFQGVTPETELVIIDDVPFKKLQEVLASLMNPEIEIHRHCQNPIRMTRPHTIITCQVDDFAFQYGSASLDNSFKRRFEIVKFPEALIETTP